MERFIPNHQHLIVDARLRCPPTSTDIVSDWLKRTVAAVGMEVLSGPLVCECNDLGNEGVTGVIVLSTSHCSIHVWPLAQVPYAKIDLYSCKEFSLEAIEPLLSEFDPYYFEFTWIDRNEPKMTTRAPQFRQCIRLVDLMPAEFRDILELELGGRLV